MFQNEMYTTPEGFELWKPLYMPDARSFADVLEYVCEWDHNAMTHCRGEIPRPELVPAPRIIGDTEGYRRIGNEIGPFCTIETQERHHRSVAVRATDATMEALEARIVTDDDTISFRVIEHAATGRALVIASHNAIIGEIYLAYIDPATIPPYPHEERDKRASEIKATMEDAGMRVVRYSNPELYAIEYRDGHNAPPTFPRAVIHADGTATLTWAASS